MDTACTSASSTVCEKKEEKEETEQTLKLCLKKEKRKKKINWTEDTVDNEGIVYLLFLLFNCNVTLLFLVDFLYSQMSFFLLRFGKEEE